jgi:hypothetical protein
MTTLLGRRGVGAFLAAAAISLALSAPAASAHPAAATLKCKSSDLRFPFRKGGPNDFGVFKLRVAGGTCATAHKVAKAWKKQFQAAFNSGHLKVPTAVDGYAFKQLPAHAAQTYSEQGKKAGTTITFDYVVPNG